VSGWTSAVYHHHVDCLTLGLWRLPERCLHRLLPPSSRVLKVIEALLIVSLLLVYSSLNLSSNNVFQKAVPTQDMTKSFALLSLYCWQNIPLLCNTLFLAQSIHPSAAPHFKSYQIHLLTFRSIQFEHHTKLCSKCSIPLAVNMNIHKSCHRKQQHFTTHKLYGSNKFVLPWYWWTHSLAPLQWIMSRTLSS
jgi:hypothetical protein